jgi:hypothetical protein
VSDQRERAVANIIQDFEEMLGDDYDPGMQYSIVPSYRVIARMNAGWEKVGAPIQTGPSDNDTMQVVARKKTPAMLEQEKLQETAGQHRQRKAVAASPRWQPTAHTLLVEKKKKLILHERGQAKLTDEQVAEYRRDVFGEGKPAAKPKKKKGAKASGKVRLGGAVRRLLGGSGDSDEAVEGGGGRGSGKGGRAKRPPKELPVLPESDET